MKPVSDRRKRIAAKRLEHVEEAALACRRAGLPFTVACALLEKESGGRNVWGHDANGVFSRDEHDTVTPVNFFQFLVRVMNGETSNGVGPCQITYAGSRIGTHRDGGFFRQMAAEGLRPWDPEDNMFFGFRLLRQHHETTGSWRAAGTKYNGEAAYGDDLVERIEQWKRRLAG